MIHRLAANQRPAIAFTATVTDTGQVIDVEPLSGIPARLPRDVIEKLEYAAMRHSYEPYILNGRATTFTTTIVMEIP
jgi:hypothetical protein